MARKLGLDAKLYYNAGTYDVPDWTEITNCLDLTLSLTKDEADVTTRGNNGFEALAGSLKKASVEFQMIYDTTDDAFSELQNAYFDNTTVEVAVMDGDITVNDAEGLRATMEVFDFTRGEPMREALTVNVVIKPTYATNAPAWYVVGESS